LSIDDEPSRMNMIRGRLGSQTGKTSMSMIAWITVFSASVSAHGSTSACSVAPAAASLLASTVPAASPIENTKVGISSSANMSQATGAGSAVGGCSTCVFSGSVHTPCVMTMSSASRPPGPKSSG
jgi:hypothetical protein